MNKSASTLSGGLASCLGGGMRSMKSEKAQHSDGTSAVPQPPPPPDAGRTKTPSHGLLDVISIRAAAVALAGAGDSGGDVAARFGLSGHGHGAAGGPPVGSVARSLAHSDSVASLAQLAVAAAAAPGAAAPQPQPPQPQPPLLPPHAAPSHAPPHASLHGIPALAPPPN